MLGRYQNYTANENCSWRIAPTIGYNYITFSFVILDVEANYDFVTIYDGLSTASTVIGSISGKSSLDYYYSSQANSVYVTFKSDDTINWSGFLLYYEAQVGTYTIGSVSTGDSYTTSVVTSGFITSGRITTAPALITTSQQSDTTSVVTSESITTGGITTGQSSVLTSGSITSGSTTAASLTTDKGSVLSLKESTPILAIVLGVTIGGLLLVVIVTAFFVARKFRNKKKITIDTELPSVSSLQLQLLTGIELGAVLGEGTFGKVYKGNWNETNVALKQLKDENDQKFQREVSLLWYIYFKSLIF